MAAAYFREGGYGAPASVIDVDSTHPGHIVVPDAQLLFTAHFHRAGPDLVLTGRDGHNHIIPGYFSGEHRPALAAPNGAMLSPDLVDLLAGSVAPNEYAQAGPVAPPEQIGRVEKVIGEVTVMRNGTAVTLNVGDAVFKSDVLQTGTGSSVGVAFPDGSAINLVANTRMALSDYSYDANSTSNSALFNLVEGGLSFVAGKVAHTGDMKIGTPVATMGIRGTAGWLYEDTVANITANAGNVTLHFAAVFDSVTNTESTYTLYAVDANGELEHNAQGGLIALATVSSTQNGLVTTLTGMGIGNLPSVGTAPPDITQQQFANLVVPQVINMAVQAIQQYQQQQQQNNQPTNPQSTSPSGSGSGGTPPPSDTNPPLQQFINLNNGTPPVIIIATVNPPTGNPTPPTTPPAPPSTPPTGPQIYTYDPPPNSPPQTFPSPIWIPPSSNTPGNLIPGPTDNVVDNSSVPLLINDSRTINDLTVGAPATVAAVSNTGGTPSSLTVSGTTDDSGLIKADSTTTDPIITFSNTVTVEAGGLIETVSASGLAAQVNFDDGATINATGEIEATGIGAAIQFAVGAVDDYGTIIADNGGMVTFDAGVTVEAGGVIEATASSDAGAVIFAGGVTLDAAAGQLAGGKVEASGSGASVTFDDGVTVGAGAEIEATGTGASVYITNGSGPQIFNAGLIEADNGGVVTFFDVQVENASGTIEALGSVASGSVAPLIEFSGVDIVGGTLETVDNGSIEVGAGLEATFFDGSTSAGAVTVDAFVQIDDGSSLELLGTIGSDGTIAVGTDLGAGAELIIDGPVTLSGSGTIELQGSNSVITGAGNPTDELINAGNTITGTGTIENLTVVNENGGTLYVDSGQTLTLINAAIDGGLETGYGATIDVQNGPNNAGSAIENATLNNANLNVSGTLNLSGDTISGGTIDAALGSVGSASPQPIEISVPGYNAIGPEVSANGEFVAFLAATSLPGQDSDTDGPIELYNATNGQLTDISALVPAADLHSGETFSDVPSISDNGHLVVFEGKYSIDNGSTSDVFLYNSQAAPGSQVTPVRSDAGQAAISGNGLVIAAEGNTSDSGDTHILVMNDGGTVQAEISGDPTYIPPDNNSDNFGNTGSAYDPSLSDDGRFVTFWSTAAEIAVTQGASTFTFQTGNSTQSNAEVYVYDTLDHTLQEASGVLGSSSQGNGNSGALDLSDDSNDWTPSISGNGRFVVFQSTASNLASNVGDANNDVSNIFVYDTHTGTVTAVTDANGSTVTGNSIRASISADGKYITFASDDSDLTGSNGGWQTYMVAIDPSTGALGSPELLSAGFPGLDDGQNNLASGVSDGGGVTAFGGAAFAFNTDQGQATLGTGAATGTITFSGLSVTDFNSADDTLQLTISVAHGTLVAAGSNGVGQQSLVIAGTLAAIDAALQTGVTYTPGSPPSANDTLSLQVTDQTTRETASFSSEFNPEATDPSQIFSGQPTATGQYDIFLSDQQTIDVTGNTTINDGAQIEGGLITVATGVILTLNDITDNDSSIHDFSGTVAFTGSSTLEGTGIFGGTNQSGQPTGQVTVGSGVTLILDDVVLKNVAVTVNSDGNTPSFQIDAGETLTWAGASSFGGPGGTGAIIIEDDGQIIHAGTLSIGFSQVTFEGSGVNTENGGNTGTVAQTLTNDGITFDGYGTFGSLDTIVNNSGAFDADVAGKALVLETGKPILNDGTFEADGGILEVLDAVTGSGSAIIDHGGTLELGNAYSQTVTFDGAGTLQLDHEQASNVEAYTVAVDGVAVGDTFDLRGLGFSAQANDQFQLSTTFDANTDTTTLTVTDTSADGAPSSAPITLSGNFANPADWSVASDSHGGIDVTALPVVSFSDIISFNNGVINTNGQVTPAIGDGGATLQLTDGNAIEAASWFANSQVSIDAFTASFDYQATPQGGNLADGFAFILQDSGAGLYALGGRGSSLGYGPDTGGGGTAISPSAAIELNLYTAPGDTAPGSHIPGTNFAENGDTGSYYSTGNVDFWDTGDTVQVVLSYDGSTLTEALTDLVTGATYSTNYDNIDLAQILGSDTAYVGFSAGTGGGASAQTVSNFTYFPGAANELSTAENTPVQLAGLGVFNVNASDPVTVTLDVKDGTLLLGSTSGITIIGGNDGSEGLLEFSGSSTEVNSALASGLTYAATSGFTGSDTLTFVANQDGFDSISDTLTIDVVAPPPPPVDTWTGTGDWVNDAAADWSFGAPPNTGDQATIAGGQAQINSDITLDGNAIQNNAEIDIGVTSGAIVTLDDGATITDGTVVIGDGSSGELVVQSGENGSATLDNVTVDNFGTLQINSGAILSIADTVTLQGGGSVTMPDGGEIAGVPFGALATLDNVDNTISGTGAIGGNADNHGDLALTNETNGTIDANISGFLTIDTGNNTIINAGTLKAENSGELTVQSSVDDTGGTVDAANGFIDFYLGITGGTATISNGGTLEYGWSSDVATTFAGPGTLVLDNQDQPGPNFDIQPYTIGTTTFDTASYIGTISGFAAGDAIILSHLTSSSTETDTWNNGTLTVTSGTTTATISLAGSYNQDDFALTSYGGDNTEVLVDPTTLTLGGLNDAGNAVPGQQVTATLGNSDLANVTYTWLLGGAVVQSGTSNIFTPTGADQGKTLDVIASFTDPNNTAATDTVTALAGTVTQSPYFWGELQFPTVVQGEHLFGVSPEYNATFGVVALAYSETSNYSTSETSYTVTRNAASLDPFFLPDSQAPQVLHTDTVDAPSRYNLILPTISFSGIDSAEGIYVYKGQLNTNGTGGNAIWQVIVTPDSNGDGGVTAGMPTEIGTTATTGETIYNVIESFKNSTAATPTATSFDVVWDQYNSSTNSYNLEVQITPINADGSFGTPTTFVPEITESGGTSVSVADTALPAWEFRSAGSSSGLVVDALAIAETDTTTSVPLNLTGTHQAVHFQDYTATGGTSGTGVSHFIIQPNLTAYASGATNEIVQPIVSGLSPYPGQVAQALQFVQVSSSNAGDYAVAWNETVTNAAGTVVLGDQVEFALYKPSAGTVEYQSEFQIADGQAQNVRVGEFADPFTSSQDDVIVAYGDDTGTHILEYGISGNGANVALLADFTDPTEQAFDNLTIMGDGRIAITYNDLVNPSPDETSQYDFTIFDLRTQGLDNPTLGTTQNNYIAGTHFSDTVTGANGVDNEYYFVGQDSANGAAPSDTFQGGSGGWNIAIFADARSDYSITPNGSAYVITGNGDDLAHTGSLTVTNVQFLAFDPASDPTPHSNTIDVNGGTFVILDGNIPGTSNPAPITIEAGATAEVDTGATYSGSVNFEAGTGALVLDQSNDFGGTISNFTGTAPDAAHSDVVELAAYNETSLSEQSSNGNLILTLDGGGGNATITFDNFDGVLNFSSDAQGDFFITDPSTAAAAANATTDSFATASGASGGIAFADANPADAVNASFAPDGGNYLGNFSLDQPAVGNGNATVSWEFDFNNEQAALAPGETVTQSYNVTVADAQNPAANQAQTVAVTIGGPGNDNFVFAPGVGADTVLNFNPQQDTIELDHFAQAQTIQELQSLITTDAHGDAIINLGHNDSITLANTTTTQLQQAIQAGHVLLH
jgi:hypothetical protein